MKGSVLALRTARLGLAVALLIAGFVLLARPWYLSWGATRDEALGALPSDEIVPHATRQETRAIDIDAAPEQVWPWLAQLGQDRGGFYSYEVLEDIAGCEMTNLDRLHPGLQNWRLGDKLWMYPPRKLGGAGHAVLRTYEPGRVLGFATRVLGTPMTEPENGSWSFVVKGTDSNHSRLLVRGRAGGNRGLPGTLFDRLVFEPMHFAMERKMMIEIKARAEGRGPTPIADTLTVALWALSFGVFVGSGVASVKASRGSLRWLGLLLAAGVVFQILTLLQPPLLVSGALVFALFAGLFVPGQGQNSLKHPGMLGPPLEDGIVQQSSPSPQICLPQHKPASTGRSNKHGGGTHWPFAQ